MMQDTDAELRGETIRIQLREPKWVDAVGFVVAAILLFGGFFSAQPINTMPGLGLILALGFFGRWRLGDCQLVLSERGIRLQAYSHSPFFFWSRPWSRPYYCVGEIPWRNFAGAGVTRSMMTQCLGINVAHLGTFLGTRVQFTDQQTVNNIKRNTLSAGSLVRPILGLVLKLVGCSQLPRSNGEVAILEWNRANYGYHVVIFGRPLWFFGRPFRGGPEKIVEVICKRARIPAALGSE
jgi:hypothetical protein